jgi:hypothetical protein
MDRRDFLRMTGLGLTALALPRWLAAASLSSASKPNIIYVSAALHRRLAVSRLGAMPVLLASSGQTAER